MGVARRDYCQQHFDQKLQSSWNSAESVKQNGVKDVPCCTVL